MSDADGNGNGCTISIMNLSSSLVTPLERLRTTRERWLLEEDCNLIAVEEVYRSLWMQKRRKECAAGEDCGGDGNDGNDDDNDVVFDQAGEKLALLMLQSGRQNEAAGILRSLGYTCRLSTKILNYEVYNRVYNGQDKANAKNNNGGPTAEVVFDDQVPCRVYDNFLLNAERKILSDVFVDPSAPYWLDHKYAVEPPSPYFSYLIPLHDNAALRKDYGCLGQIIDRIQKLLIPWKKASLSTCTYCEMWAHNRPHASGHQFHFDSDNEGMSGVRNPVASTIIYLTDESVGGPSVITNQRLASRHIADRGWMSYGKENRLTAFDGKVLHGVIPGKGMSPSRLSARKQQNRQPYHRRVTVMLAFWKRIKVRDGDDLPGAARPFPMDSKVAWAAALRTPLGANTATANTTNPTVSNSNNNNNCDYENPMQIRVAPVPVDNVYETLDGIAWSRKMGFPNYDEVFQGF